MIHTPPTNMTHTHKKKDHFFLFVGEARGSTSILLRALSLSLYAGRARLHEDPSREKKKTQKRIIGGLFQIRIKLATHKQSCTHTHRHTPGSFTFLSSPFAAKSLILIVAYTCVDPLFIRRLSVHMRKGEKVGLPSSSSSVNLLRIRVRPWPRHPLPGSSLARGGGGGGRRPVTPSPVEQQVGRRGDDALRRHVPHLTVVHASPTHGILLILLGGGASGKGRIVPVQDPSVVVHHGKEVVDGPIRGCARGGQVRRQIQLP